MKYYLQKIMNFATYSLFVPLKCALFAKKKKDYLLGQHENYNEAPKCNCTGVILFPRCSEISASRLESNRAGS